jgi:sporulation protein YabP
MDKGGVEMPDAPHELTLTERSRFLATGVLQVISFDDGEILLETLRGVLMLRGEEMNITRLDLTAGEIAVEGTISALEYREQRSKKIREKGKNILERLIK